jgi:uncharacterized membrane protein
VKKIPWKGIFWGSLVMFLLVLARCIATVARELYYGRQAWLNVVLQDRWLYVGIAAVVVFYISAIVCIVRGRKA